MNTRLSAGISGRSRVNLSLLKCIKGEAKEKLPHLTKNYCTAAWNWPWQLAYRHPTFSARLGTGKLASRPPGSSGIGGRDGIEKQAERACCHHILRLSDCCRVWHVLRNTRLRRSAISQHRLKRLPAKAWAYPAPLFFFCHHRRAPVWRSGSRVASHLWVVVEHR